MWQQKYSRVRLDLIQIWFSFDIKALKVEKTASKGQYKSKTAGRPGNENCWPKDKMWIVVNC